MYKTVLYIPGYSACEPQHEAMRRVDGIPPEKMHKHFETNLV